MSQLAAILTDAFPVEQRMALASIRSPDCPASFSGCSPGACWRRSTGEQCLGQRPDRNRGHHLVVSESAGDGPERHRTRIDWIGNFTFTPASALLISITTASSPTTAIRPGVESQVLATFSAAGAAGDLLQSSRPVSPSRWCVWGCSGSARSPPAISRHDGRHGARWLQFMLIIWLQGVWLPLHGYSFQTTPLWAGCTCCADARLLAAGPLCGHLADLTGPPVRDRGSCSSPRVYRHVLLACRLQLPGVCRPDRPQRHRQEMFSHPTRGDHEQRARGRARSASACVRPFRTPARPCRRDLLSLMTIGLASSLPDRLTPD